MMYNIPGQSVTRWIDDLGTLIKLGCDHIAFFSLTSETGTPLYNQVQSGEIQLPDSDIVDEMFIQGSQLLTENGFIQYEVAHFTKQGKECQQNQHYWKLDPYLAFGPSAYGYDGEKRWWNSSSLNDYIKKLSRNESPLAGFENLSNTDRFNETVIYGLRTKGGIPRALLENNENNCSLHSYLIKWEDHLEISKNIIRIKPGHYHLVDEITTDIMAVD